MSPKKILSASTHSSLLATRELILKNAGYAVTSVSSWAEFEEACGKGSYDLLILGQSLAPSAKHDMDDFARKHCPKMKIAEFYIVAASVPAKYHFHAGGKPQELLDFIAETLIA